MPGISNGIQSFNDHVMGYSGRHCPTSLEELKNNISKNFETCAKATTIFLNSSVGLGVAMGIFGIATASVCTQTNLIDVFASTTSFPSTEMPPKFADLCFKGTDNPFNLTSLDPSSYGSCQHNDGTTQSKNVLCFSYEDFQGNRPDLSIPQCPVSSNDTHQKYVYMVPKRGDNSHIWRIGDSLDCLSGLLVDTIQSLLNTTAQTTNATPFPLTSTYCQPMTNTSKTSYGLNNTYCWQQPIGENYSALSVDYPNFFSQQTQCNMSTPLTTTTTTTTLNTYTSGDPSSTETQARIGRSLQSIALTAMMPEEDGSCSTCSTMTIAFGAGSAAILIATVGKIIYNQFKKSDVRIPKTPSTSVKKLAALTLSEGLLLGASGVGSGVLISSLIDPCSPVSESTKKAVIASTVLYWSSAAATVMSNCITSSTKENSRQEENPETGIPMLEAPRPSTDL